MKPRSSIQTSFPIRLTAPVGRGTALLAATLAFAAGSAQAETWTGLGADTHFNTAGNWLGGTVSPNWGAITFDANTVNGTMALDNFQGYAQISLNSGLTTDITIVTGNHGSLIQDGGAGHGGITIAADSRNLTLNNGEYALWNGGGTVAWDIGAGRTLTANCPINYSFARLAKTGAGTAVLNGAGNYGSVTDIQAGTLIAANSAALGAGGFNGGTMTWVRDGATLGLQGGISLNEHMHITGTGVGGLGAIRSISGNNALTTNFALDGNAAIGVDADTLTISSSIYHDSGSHGITKVGAGTLTLTGTNTYTGATTVSGGSLVGNSTSLPTAVALSNNANVTFNQTSEGRFGQAVTGTGSFTKTGNGTLSLTAASTYSGATTIDGGTVKLDAGYMTSTVGSAAVATANSFTFSAAANNTLAGLSPTANSNGSGGAEGSAGVTVLTDGINPAANMGNHLAQGYTIGNNAVITYTLPTSAGGYDITQLNVYSGWANTGRDRITLNDFTYSTHLNPTVFNTITGSSVNYEGGTGQALSTITATGGVLASGVYAIRFNFGAQENGYVGYRELEVVGTALTTQQAATDFLPTATALAIGSSGTLDLYGGVQTVASLADGTGGGGTITNTGALASTLTLNPGSGSTSFSGVIGGGSSPISLVKSGNGTQVLTGANAYTGATTVNGGTLAVNGSLANTTTTIASGGRLQGSGSIGGAVTVQSGGTLAAGNSIESLTIGALSLESGSFFAYEADNDAAAGVAGDLTAVSGNLTLSLDNLATLTLTELGSGSWSGGDKLTLISYSGIWNGGLFTYGGNTLADGGNVNFSGTDWVFDYNDTSAGTNFTGDLTGSSFVTMTAAVPEPNVAALLGGLGVFALLRRRR